MCIDSSSHKRTSVLNSVISLFINWLGCLNDVPSPRGHVVFLGDANNIVFNKLVYLIKQNNYGQTRNA